MNQGLLAAVIAVAEFMSYNVSISGIAVSAAAEKLFGVLHQNGEQMPVIIAIAVMGLGQITYFISRPVDYSIMILPAIFCMTILLNGTRWNLERKK